MVSIFTVILIKYVGFHLYMLILIISHGGRFFKKTAPCLDSCHWDTKQSNYTDDLTWIRLNKYICRKFTARQQLVGFRSRPFLRSPEGLFVI